MNFELKRVSILTITDPITNVETKIPLQCYSPKWLDESNDTTLLVAVTRGIIESLAHTPATLMLLSEALFILFELIDRRKPSGEQRKKGQGLRATLRRQSAATGTEPDSKADTKK